MDSLLPIFTNTDLAALYTLRGQMVILLYEWDRVLENYDTALTLDADYAPAYFYRGVLYYSVLARERALADFETYLEMASDGDNAADAARYVESIRLELDALSG
jgi:tetratricopeptide (TPR) repeat protein